MRRNTTRKERVERMGEKKRDDGEKKEREEEEGGKKTLKKTQFPNSWLRGP